MKHLSQEEFVLSYYGEPELGADRRAHLDACEECGRELTSLAAVLDTVTPLEVPEPAHDYEARVWDRLQWRLRGERRKSSQWMKWAAVAALFAMAFFAGLLWRNRPDDVQQIATDTTATTTPIVKTTAPTAAQQQQSRDRVLLVVVGEHFDESERVLIELTNLNPDDDVDLTGTRERAEELLASNRLYRTSATDRGEGDVATLLDELEPVLMQIAHASGEESAEELRSIQKRVEAKGLVFKLRVVKADVKRTTRPAAPSTSI